MNSDEELPPVEGENVERINKDDMKPLFDNNHEHVYAKDDEEDNDDYFSESCMFCPVGRLIGKH